MDVLIDLDAAPPPGTRQSVDSPAARFDPRLLLIVGLLLVLVVPASGVPHPALRRLLGVPADGDSGAVLHNGVLYVGDTFAMAAYQLPDGRLLWRTPVRGPVTPQVVDDRAGVLVSRFDRGPASTLQVYDLATGASLWQRPDVTATLVPGGGKLLGVVHGVVDGTGEHGVTLLDSRTGAVGWQRTYPMNGALLLDESLGRPGGSNLVGIRDNLSVRVFDVDTGAPIGGADLVARVPAFGGDSVGFALTLIGGVLLVTTTRDDGPPAATTLWALDAVTGEPLWHVTLPPGELLAADCGALFCLSGNGGWTTVDPGTGAIVGRGRWRLVQPYTGRWLLARSVTSAAVVGTDLVSRLTLDRWSVVAVYPTLVLAQPAEPATGTWISVVDPAVPVRRLLGSVPVTGIDAVFTDGRYLVCHLASGPVEVYALR